jgi:HEAT repeat protein
MDAGEERLSIGELIRLLRDPDGVVRAHAAFVIGLMGEDARDAVPILIEMLQYGMLGDQRLAAMTLGTMGAAAADAIPMLLATTNEEDDTLASMAAWALEEIQLPRAA